MATRATKDELFRLAADRKLTGLFIVSDEDYHGGPGFSASNICDFLKSPAHMRAAKRNPRRTAAMELGTRIHEYMLQPDRFKARYVRGEDNPHDWNKERKAYLEWQKAFVERLEGREAVDPGEWDTITAVAQSVCDHVSAGLLLEGATFELAAFVQDEETGFVRKAKADILTPTGIIADLKTTIDASKDGFRYEVRKWKYHVKAAWYLDVFNAVAERAGQGFFDAFVWIAAETKDPYGVATHAAGERTLDKGREIYKKALEKLEICVQTDTWPCYSGEIQALELPEYDLRSTDDE